MLGRVAPDHNILGLLRTRERDCLARFERSVLMVSHISLWTERNGGLLAHRCEEGVQIDVLALQKSSTVHLLRRLWRYVR